MLRKEEKKRDFDSQADESSPVKTYEKMYTQQTRLFVQSKKQHYSLAPKTENPLRTRLLLSIKEAFAKLSTVTDESDPDTDLPQTIHALQTGEALKTFLREDAPEKLKKVSIKALFTAEEWQQLPYHWKLRYDSCLDDFYPQITDWSWSPLIGFIHDIGKVLATEDWGKLPQYAVVGDTFPVGAPFSAANVYYKKGFHLSNNDLNISNNKLGVFGQYDRNCGFRNVDMSYGHDEYVYRWMSRNSQGLPKEALSLARFHSFYAWHTARKGRNGERGYLELADKEDWDLLPLIKFFSKYADLYSKTKELPDPSLIEDYYKRLDKFFPGCPENQCDNDGHPRLVF